MSSRSRKNRSLVRQVRRAYSQDDLARVLTMPEREFGKAFGMETVEVKRRDGYVQPFTYRGQEPSGDHFHFRDNGARVLAVAHLDTVVAPGRRTPRFYGSEHGPSVRSGALDDRLGAYVILKLLPQLGITTDVLLTTGEEDGESTASEFEAGREYDHVIEFDRGGTDVVMYQYEDKATREAVQACGAPVGRGSFSDIAYMEHLGVKAFNWGAGYQGVYHSEAGYAHLADTFRMTAKYLQFADQNAGVRMEHVPDEYDPYFSRRGSQYDPGWLYGDAGRFPLQEECEFCWAVMEAGLDYCPECSTCTSCYAKQDDCLCYTGHAMSGRPLLSGTS